MSAAPLAFSDKRHAGASFNNFRKDGVRNAAAEKPIPAFMPYHSGDSENSVRDEGFIDIVLPVSETHSAGPQRDSLETLHQHQDEEKGKEEEGQDEITDDEDEEQEQLTGRFAGTFVHTLPTY